MEVLASEISSNEKSAFTEEEDDYYEFSESDSLESYNMESSSSDDDDDSEEEQQQKQTKQTKQTATSESDEGNLKRRKRTKRILNKDNKGTGASISSPLLVDGADILNKSLKDTLQQVNGGDNSNSTTSPLSNGSGSSGSNGSNGYLDDLDSEHNNGGFGGSLTDNDGASNGDNNNNGNDNPELPLLNLFQKFLNREAIKVLQQRHAAINNRLQKLKKVVDPKKLRERGKNLKNEKEKIKQLIKLKKTELDDHMNAPPFIRLLDKCAFTLGLIILCVSEFVLVRSPESMYLWYTILIIPLMAVRFFMYHREKYHYFMLDFCYLCQILLLFYLFGHQYVLGESTTPNLFKLVFALSNGPLAWGTIVWRNSLVFHDVDKLTSVFIHLCPPIVTYCLRWYPNNYTTEFACGGVECYLSFKETFLIPLYVYFFWQVFYFIKTEVADRSKLAQDKDIMTSSRWMSVKQPHPIYKWCIKRGYKVSATAILMLVQLTYTLGTLVSLPFLIQSFWLHTVFIIFIFVTVSWNGANYYFEVFSENYSARLKSEIKHKQSPSREQPLKITSIWSFLKFLTLFLLFLVLFLKLIL